MSEALNDRAFWGGLELLNALLEPVSAVITTMQADDATLADATRYWAYLGQELLKQIPMLPIGAGTALFWWYGYLPSGCGARVARVPHPSVSRQASRSTSRRPTAGARGRGTASPAVWRSRWTRASSAWHCRRASRSENWLCTRASCLCCGAPPPRCAHSQHVLTSQSRSRCHDVVWPGPTRLPTLCLAHRAPQVVKRCMHEFVKYIGGSATYDLVYGGEGFSVMAWWRGVKYAGNAELAMLAEVLFSIVPHSASVKCAFSKFGWCQSKRRNRLKPDTLGKLTAIKQALHSEGREANKRHAPSATVSEESNDEDGNDQETSLGVEELVAELEALSKRLAPLFEEAADLMAEAPLSRGGEPFVELLMGSWDGLDMQALLHSGYVPDVCIAEVPGGPVGPAQHFDVAALWR